MLSHSFSGLSIGQVLPKLENRHQGQAPGWQGWLTIRREQPCEILVLEYGTQLVAEGQVQVALGKSSPSHLYRFFWNRLNRPWLE
jgi:hypothetical protein